MHVNVQKWGNSLGFRIPSFVTKKLDLHPGSAVELRLEGDHFSIYSKHYHLADLLSEVMPENIHSIQMNDASEGREEW
jgi:antitoxin MazE